MTPRKPAEAGHAKSIEHMFHRIRDRLRSARSTGWTEQRPRRWPRLRRAFEAPRGGDVAHGGNGGAGRGTRNPAPPAPRSRENSPAVNSNTSEYVLLSLAVSGHLTGDPLRPSIPLSDFPPLVPPLVPPHLSECTHACSTPIRPRVHRGREPSGSLATSSSPGAMRISQAKQFIPSAATGSGPQRRAAGHRDELTRQESEMQASGKSPERRRPAAPSPVWQTRGPVRLNQQGATEGVGRSRVKCIQSSRGCQSRAWLGI